ncbi:type II toxin-antitoxin system VapC family toxin [Aminobacter aganoensis]|uniref:PIN domain nuclease of toxin-antitoxin system n=1 Tax=Aminobacter aganoensis TaxID=83264 RepID=A0A7X0KJE0_9HYPH|nr:PIN domain nuclease of toxin-antitoxin system [Aminobacter aganoensis]
MSDPKFLLDTHVFLWALRDDERLSPEHRMIIARGEGIAISAVSIWEIAIKRSSGKLRVDGDMVQVLNERGTPILSINEHHASRVEHLADHHRDPFDRLLIAQAQVENLVILTADPMFARYDVALA